MPHVSKGTSPIEFAPLIFYVNSEEGMYFSKYVCVILLVSGVSSLLYADDEPIKNNAEEHAQEKVQDVINAEIETIVVSEETFTRQLNAEIALTPGSVALIDAEESVQRDMSSLADLLHFTPGIWAASTTGNDSMLFSSRGSNLDATNYDMNGIKLLQDGLSVTTADGNNHNRILDPLSMRYATIAHGANALSYGASNLGGAIDFTTPTALNSPAREMYLNGGSHGKQQARLSVGKIINEDIDALVTLENKNWEGYREHNEQTRLGIYGNVGWQINTDIENRWFITQIQNEEELAGTLSAAQVKQDADQASAGAVGGNFQVNVDTRRLANKTTWTIDESSSLEFGLSLEKQTLFHPIVDKVMVDFDGPGPQAPVEVFSLLIDTDHQDIATMLRYKKTMNQHQIITGFNYGVNKVEGGHYRNDAGKTNGLTTEVDNSASSFEAFILDRFSVDDRWTLIYGTQVVSAKRSVKNFDVASSTLRNPEESYDSVNPRAGVIFNTSKESSLFANVSKLYEAPTNFELQDDVAGSDETLEAMTGSVIEVGSRGAKSLSDSSRVNWELALYSAKISDEILSLDDPAAPGTSLSTNIEETKHSGAEAMLAADFSFGEFKQHSIEPLLSITVNKFNFVDDATYGNNRLPAAPKHVINGQLIYQNVKGYYAGPTFDIVGERYADFSNTYKVDSYNLLGFRAGYSKNTWQVFAEAKNISNKDYISTFSVLDKADPTSEILNPGLPTSLYVGMTMEF